MNLVILATPPGFRPIHLEAAVKAGKNIFCEKPVAVDATGIRKCYALVEESKKKNIAIVAGTQRRHQKGYIETMKMVHDGAIGDIRRRPLLVERPPLWFNKRPEGMADSTYQLTNWYHYLWLCGDHIVEQHVHNLDVINWVMKGHPVKAVGFGGRRHSGRRATRRTSGTSGTTSRSSTSTRMGVKLYSYCRHIPGDDDVSETLYGSTGNCYTRDGVYEINKKSVASDDIAAYVQEHIDLLNSIRAGRPLNELQQVTDSTFTAIFGRNASYACRTLKWADALASAEDTMPKDFALDKPMESNRAPVPGTWTLPPRA